MKNAITLSIALATTLAFSGMALAQVTHNHGNNGKHDKHGLRAVAEKSGNHGKGAEYKGSDRRHGG